jgi:hypothetical protein
MSMFEERGDYFLNNQQLKKQLGVDVHPLQRYTNLSQAQVMESAKGWGPNAQAGLREMYLDQRKAKITGKNPEDTGAYGEFFPSNSDWSKGRTELHNNINEDGTPNYTRRLETVNHEANHFGNWMGRNVGGFGVNDFNDRSELATRIRNNSVDKSRIPSLEVDGINKGVQNMIAQGGSPFMNIAEMRNDPSIQGTSNVPERDRINYELALNYENATAKHNFENNPVNKGKTYTPFTPRNFGFDSPFQFNTLNTPPPRQVLNMSMDWGNK